MGDPISMGLAGVGMASTLFGGVQQAQGAKVQAQAQAQADLFKSQEYQYQASIAQQNKVISEQNAAYARYAGEVEAQQEAIQVREDIGNIRSQQGAGNLDVNSGSNADVRRSQMDVGEESIAMIRSNAAKTAYGYEVQAYQFGEQANWDLTGSSYEQQAANLARTAGDINANASILGTVGKLAGMGASAYKSGTFTS